MVVIYNQQLNEIDMTLLPGITDTFMFEGKLWIVTDIRNNTYTCQTVNPANDERRIFSKTTMYKIYEDED